MKEVISGIYMIQNKINGKIYIGQSRNIYARWKTHISSAKRKPRYPIHLAINSLGKDNFSFSILERCVYEELNNREKFYIALYHSNNNEFGYNLTNGGDNEYFWTDELKNKCSNILKIRIGKDENLKKRISEKITELWQDEDYKRHMSEIKKGIPHEYNRKTLIKCTETNEIKYECEWIKLGYQNVRPVCKHLRNHCKGLHFEFVDENNKIVTDKELKEYNEQVNKRMRRLCLDPFTNLPISYSTLCAKKQKNPKYKNINLKLCIIKDEDIKYYMNKKLIEKELNKEKSKQYNKESRKLRYEKNKSKLYLDPFTKLPTSYNHLRYLKLIKIEYKNIKIKDCEIINYYK